MFAIKLAQKSGALCQTPLLAKNGVIASPMMRRAQDRSSASPACSDVESSCFASFRPQPRSHTGARTLGVRFESCTDAYSFYWEIGMKQVLTENLVLLCIQRNLANNSFTVFPTFLLNLNKLQHL